MKIEHLALNVPDARAMAKWYEKHTGMRVLRRQDEPPHAHFIADTGEHTVLEIYSNPLDPLPDLRSWHPLRFHLAFDVVDVDGEARRLCAAGAKLVERQDLPDGTGLAMLRDPWGLPVQLVRRGTPLLHG